jgi:hypothetical protein
MERSYLSLTEVCQLWPQSDIVWADLRIGAAYDTEKAFDNMFIIEPFVTDPDKDLS